MRKFDCWLCKYLSYVDNTSCEIQDGVLIVDLGDVVAES